MTTHWYYQRPTDISRILLETNNTEEISVAAPSIIGLEPVMVSFSANINSTESGPVRVQVFPAIQGEVSVTLTDTTLNCTGTMTSGYATGMVYQWATPEGLVLETSDDMSAEFSGADPEVTYTVEWTLTDSVGQVVTLSGSNNVTTEDNGKGKTLALFYRSPRVFLSGAPIEPQAPLVVNAVSSDPIVMSLESGDLPLGLTFGTDGIISGTPEDANPAETYTFVAAASNSMRTATSPPVVYITSSLVGDFTLTTVENAPLIYGVTATSTHEGVLNEIDWKIMLDESDPITGEPLPQVNITDYNATGNTFSATVLLSNPDLNPPGIDSGFGSQETPTGAVEFYFTFLDSDTGAYSASRSSTWIIPQTEGGDIQLSWFVLEDGGLFFEGGNCYIPNKNGVLTLWAHDGTSDLWYPIQTDTIVKATEPGNNA